MYASNQVHIRYFLLEYILWLECVKTGKDNYTCILSHNNYT